ncbi:MAG: hypothetical protein FD167_1433, partial [bacterium]
IDLDPASCKLANRTIKAKKIFTLADDGLVQPWNGRIFLNPPYFNMKVWVCKLLEEIELSRVSQAILLANAATIMLPKNWTG